MLDAEHASHNLGNVLYRLGVIEQSQKDRDLALKSELREAIDNFTKAMEKFADKYESRQEAFLDRMESNKVEIQEVRARVLAVEQSVSTAHKVFGAIAVALMGFMFQFAASHLPSAASVVLSSPSSAHYSH